MSSRRKGAEGERSAAKDLTDLGFPCERMARIGKSADDLHCPSLDRLCLEVKRNESIDVGTTALEDAYLQAAGQCGTRKPVVMWRRNGNRKWRLTWMHDGYLVTAACDARILKALNGGGM